MATITEAGINDLVATTSLIDGAPSLYVTASTVDANGERVRTIDGMEIWSTLEQADQAALLALMAKLEGRLKAMHGIPQDGAP